MGQEIRNSFLSCLQKMGYTIQEIPIFIFMGVVGKRVLLFQFD